MTFLKRAFLASTAAFLGGAAMALAGTPAETFASMDTDANGLVSETEFVAFATTKGGHSAEEASAKFAKLAGTDGNLSLAELEAASLVEDTQEDDYGSGS